MLALHFLWFLPSRYHGYIILRWPDFVFVLIEDAFRLVSPTMLATGLN